MNATKLGLRITSSVLATALTLAPINGAVAAPAAAPVAPPAEEAAPEGEVESPEADAPEGETPEGETPEGVGGEGVEGEGVEGEAPAGEGIVEIAPPEPEPEPEEPEVEEPEVEEPEAEEPEDEELALTPEGPLRPAEPTWGPKDQYPMNGKGMLITGGIVTGLGAAFIVTSVLITSCDFDSALSCKFGDQRDFLIPVAVTATGLGLLLLGVGVGNHVKYKRWERWAPETAVVPTMVPGGGGGVAVVGRF
jgi:hypothetical protein